MDTLSQTQACSLPAGNGKTITVTERERQFLIEMLNREIAELRSENYHAESHDIKELLKEREACAKHLLQQIQADAT
jgi:hypothetical protein